MERCLQGILPRFPCGRDLSCWALRTSATRPLKFSLRSRLSCCTRAFLAGAPVQSLRARPSACQHAMRFLDSQHDSPHWDRLLCVARQLSSSRFYRGFSSASPSLTSNAFKTSLSLLQLSPVVLAHPAPLSLHESNSGFTFSQ